MKSRLRHILVIAVLLLAVVAIPGGGDTGSTQSIRAEVAAEAAPLTGPVGFNPVGMVTAAKDRTVSIKNPTFGEVRDFILRDTTNRHEFILNEYECRHFAAEVNNNAEAAGLRCAVALLCYRQGQHAVVAFETADRGLIYIEPQTDALIRPEVGGKYQGEEVKEIILAW